tara:strand:- start:695 stop:862 length:168 start_codon:yes stop_codon:yes gene_type:complete
LAALEGVAMKKLDICWPRRGLEVKITPSESASKHLHRGATSNMERSGELSRNANE